MIRAEPEGRMSMAWMTAGLLIGGFTLTMSLLAYDEWRIRRDIKRRS